MSTKHQPRGYRILHEDRDIIAGNKAAGFLTVAAKWNRDQTIHSALDLYVKKGNPRNPQKVFVVHRLDQATTGVLLFAKSEAAQQFLKNDWKQTRKTYLAVVHGSLQKKSGKITSFLEEDEDYVVHSKAKSTSGKLAETEYEVLAENSRYSLVKINLLTGRKNQIRVHMSDLGHPVVGDGKYGKPGPAARPMALHSARIEFTHPHSKKRIEVRASVPAFFEKLVFYNYDTGWT
jgi:tRNA pseudouridine32 synthase/23S rRNA pseudouridine746 synthase/23S rRNA pseudouridine1911/1915/1917 synthase